MDGSSSREGGGAMKPVVLRVCIGIVLSATGLILARLVSRKEDTEVTSSASNPEFSSSGSGRNDGEEGLESQVHQNREILRLKSRFEELQKKEYEMEMRFERYCNLKDQEVLLMEHKTLLSIEKCQLEFFRKEVATMEEDYKRGNDLVTVYLKLVGKIQELRTENWLLEGKGKKLRRRTKQLSLVVRHKNRRIIGAEKEFLKCIDELEMKNNVVKVLADEVKDLKDIITTLQEEKEDVSSESSNSKPEMVVSVEDYTRVLQKYDDLKKDYENEVNEVINLRWSNACLRHEVMKHRNHYGEVVYSPNGNLQDQGNNSLALTVTDGHEENHHNQHHVTSRRKRMMKKIKKWVEGTEKGKPTKSEDRCFGRHSLTIEPEDGHIFHSRRSCSSV